MNSPPCLCKQHKLTMTQTHFIEHRSKKKKKKFSSQKQNIFLPRNRFNKCLPKPQTLAVSINAFPRHGNNLLYNVQFIIGLEG